MLRLGPGTAFSFLDLDDDTTQVRVSEGSLAVTVHRLFPGRLQATGQTLYSSLSYGLGGGAGLLIAGWSWERLGAAASFSISAAFALAGAALVTWRVRV